MSRTIKILLQTTIPATADDWSIARFGLLAKLLREERDVSIRRAILLALASSDYQVG